MERMKRHNLLLQYEQMEEKNEGARELIEELQEVIDFVFEDGYKEGLAKGMQGCTAEERD